MKTDRGDFRFFQALREKRQAGFEMEDPGRRLRTEAQNIFELRIERKRFLDAEKLDAAAPKSRRVSGDELHVTKLRAEAKNQHRGTFRRTAAATIVERAWEKRKS